MRSNSGAVPDGLRPRREEGDSGAHGGVSALVASDVGPLHARSISVPVVASDPPPAAPVRCFVLDAPPKARTPRRRRGEEIWSRTSWAGHWCVGQTKFGPKLLASVKLM
jgi:hypothetical protein